MGNGLFVVVFIEVFFRVVGIVPCIAFALVRTECVGVVPVSIDGIVTAEFYSFFGACLGEFSDGIASEWSRVDDVIWADF